MNATEEREVVEETINAYRVQKLSDGSVRIKSGGHVVTRDTYHEALQQYAETEHKRIEDLPEHIYDDRRNSIYDGFIPLYSLDSSGFTPREILEEVTAHPYEVLERDL